MQPEQTPARRKVGGRYRGGWLSLATPRGLIVTIGTFAAAYLVWRLADALTERTVLLLVGVLFALPLVRAAARGPGRCDVTITGPTALQVGEEGTFVVELTHRDARRGGGATVSLSTPILSGAVAWIPDLRPGETARTTVTRRALARGSAPAVAVGVRRREPFGTFNLGYELSMPSPIRVYPASAPTLPLRQLAATGDSHASRRWGTEVTGVRQWSPGDSLRAVHWRATARHGDIVVAEREEPISPVLRAIVIGSSFDAQGEHGIARLAATATKARSSGDSARVIWWDPSVGLCLAPTASRQAVLDWFADLGSAELARQLRPAGQRDLRELLGEEAYVVRGTGVNLVLSGLQGIRLIDAATGHPLSLDPR
ncbi:MAG: DUF58 domain-containing protein [Actinomycetales bacterium]